MKRLVLILCLMASPVFAVQPGEMMTDPVQEARARDLSKGLRCLVCRNESIDESNAELARDLRLLVRERIAAGDSDEQAIAFIVDRYGEYVLLRPTVSGSNIVLWIAGPVMLILGLGVAGLYVRRRRNTAETPIAALSLDEASQLKKILEQ
ncbi:cytochrome c-type biogenesis protein [Pseudogemmobacter sp. W21_MBD1_M6]|jgi:cytochrome c-type biogenesis protein CcmH|uniref:cytochrome c-type biogenesis protein n=1 Tax=Pseudogemmobacter sp. W21_MBD1_M6 TaxID=3240271 RepID=UPI003F9982F8